MGHALRRAELHLLASHPSRPDHPVVPDRDRYPRLRDISGMRLCHGLCTARHGTIVASKGEAGRAQDIVTSRADAKIFTTWHLPKSRAPRLSERKHYSRYHSQNYTLAGSGARPQTMIRT